MGEPSNKLYNPIEHSKASSIIYNDSIITSQQNDNLNPSNLSENTLVKSNSLKFNYAFLLNKFKFLIDQHIIQSMILRNIESLEEVIKSKEKQEAHNNPNLNDLTKFLNSSPVKSQFIHECFHNFNLKSIDSAIENCSFKCDLVVADNSIIEEKLKSIIRKSNKKQDQQLQNNYVFNLLKNTDSNNSSLPYNSIDLNSCFQNCLTKYKFGNLILIRSFNNIMNDLMKTHY